MQARNENTGNGAADNPYRLMRARVRQRDYDALEALARDVSEDSGRHVPVADLIRQAIRDLLRRRSRLFSER